MYAQMRAVVWLGLLAAIVSCVQPALATPPNASAAVDVEAILDQLEADGDFHVAEQELQTIFDRLVLSGAEREAEALADVAFSLRLVRQLKATDEAIRVELLTYLHGSPKLARTLAFLVREDLEKPGPVYALLDRLRRERGESLETFAHLAAAICVVHDEPLARRFNEHAAESPDPIALFDFFASNEKRMFFGMRSIPAELLVYVVDATATVEELAWALDRYAGDTMVGARFFEIEYDFDHLRTGQPKKVTLAGWNLPNILRYGGVCADQAYYAMTVGKAIGVPTAYAVGRGGDVGHAWVGFLQSDGRRAWWNFNTGRYESYQGLKGDVFDPQIRRNVPDGFVSLLAEFSQRNVEDRHLAASLTDAAVRLIDLQGAAVAASPDSGDAPSDPRTRTLRNRAPSVLGLLEHGLRACPGYAPAWFAVRDRASEGQLSLEEKKRWAGIFDRLCSSRYPDFSLSILIPMVASVDDVREQDKLWTAAFRAYQGRHDLAAEIRMSQAEMWEAAGELNTAGQCYLDVINRYANAGPFVLEALAKAEKLLIASNRHNQILPLFAQTWQRIRRPEEVAGMYTRQSNWYRVGLAYAIRLEKAGRTSDAMQVRAAIGGQ